MSVRAWVLIALAIAVVGWWFSPQSPRVPGPPAPIAGTSVHCPPPPRVLAGDAPLQSGVPATLSPFRLTAAELRPLAGFSLEARVLSREDYSFGREADLSPTDLALGWGRMRDEAVLSRLDAVAADGWRWRSSLSRDDSGSGACEVVYVCSLTSD